MKQESEIIEGVHDQPKMANQVKPRHIRSNRIQLNKINEYELDPMFCETRPTYAAVDVVVVDFHKGQP